MADKVILNKSILTGIGDAIREKKGTTDLIPSVNMASEISSIGGGDDMLQQRVDATNSCAHLFYEYKGDNVDFIKNLDTSNVTSMERMFYYCSALTTIPQLDTSNVTIMSCMFYYCSALTTIPQLDTSNVKDAAFLFYGCKALTTIPQLDTSNVTSMQAMFQNCSALTTIPALNVSNVNNLLSMFSGCTKLKSILMYGMKKSFDISKSTQFEQSDLVTILNNLAIVTTTQTLTMGSTNLAKLTDEDKAIATNKNWTLA